MASDRHGNDIPAIKQPLSNESELSSYCLNFAERASFLASSEIVRRVLLSRAGSLTRSAGDARTPGKTPSEAWEKDAKHYDH